MVMMVWQAELHQGKKSIILDAKKPAAREVIRKAVEAADVVLLNKMDSQLVSLGLNRETLDVVNKKAVLLQLKSHQVRARVWVRVRVRGLTLTLTQTLAPNPNPKTRARSTRARATGTGTTPRCRARPA